MLANFHSNQKKTKLTLDKTRQYILNIWKGKETCGNLLNDFTKRQLVMKRSNQLYKKKEKVVSKYGQAVKCC